MSRRPLIGRARDNWHGGFGPGPLEKDPTGASPAAYRCDICFRDEKWVEDKVGSSGTTRSSSAMSASPPRTDRAATSTSRPGFPAVVSGLPQAQTSPIAGRF